MSSNFAFQPFGLSRAVTVVATAGTVTFSIVKQGGVTATVSAGNYQPASARVVNNGTATAFLAFGASAPTVSVSTGMAVRGASDSVFTIKGMPAMAFISAGTTTLNISLGEGL